MPEGDEYEGSTRTPSGRPKTDGFPKIVDPFRHLSSADYRKLKAKHQQMADDRRDQRKKVQAEIADIGSVKTMEDPFEGPFDKAGFQVDAIIYF